MRVGLEAVCERGGGADETGLACPYLKALPGLNAPS